MNISFGPEVTLLLLSVFSFISFYLGVCVTCRYFTDHDVSSTDSENDYSILELPIEKNNWCDADSRMFIACFTILGQYVDDELGKSEDDDSYKGYRLHCVGGSDQAAIDLWLWYRDQLPLLETDYFDSSEKCLVIDSSNGLVKTSGIESKYPHDWVDVVKDEKLRDLINLRQSLWT